MWCINLSIHAKTTRYEARRINFERGAGVGVGGGGERGGRATKKGHM